MNKTIGIVAHVDAGKTTLTEQMLYITSTIKQAGRVDSKNTVLDYHSIEKERGITVFSDQASLRYKDSTIHLIDTPGHVDFSSEMERALKILDCAVIVLSAVEGIQGHTETVWKLLRQYGIPTIFFINKLDRQGANFNKIYEDIAANLTKDICVFTRPNKDEDFSYVYTLFDDRCFDNEIIEFLSEHDDLLLEKYLNDENISYAELKDSLIKQFSSCNIFPCLCGSGLKNIGVDNMLDFINSFVHTNYSDDDKFGALVYKIKHDENNNKLTYVKVISGTVKMRDIIEHRAIEDSEAIQEKINHIKVSVGNNYLPVSSISAGEYGVLVGVNNSFVGEGLGKCGDYVDFSIKPVLQSIVKYAPALNPKEVLNIFQILNVEDPSLGVEWNSTLGQLQINVMGVIQLEVLKHQILERFNLQVDFEEPEVLYKETIKNETTGFGHFEPYRHYAEVKFRMSPLKRSAGITYSSSINHDILNYRWQKSILKLINPSCRKGVLTGSPITDIYFELIKGSAHQEYTAGGDFAQAVTRAVRQGLESTECILLEPYYKFKITIHQDLCGRVMNDITKMYGTFDAPITIGNNSIISGIVPVASSMNYAKELLSFSKGKGSISFLFDGYNVCHNTDEVIEKYSYDSNSDPEFTSNSVYCSKGAVYSVPGHEAENHRRG
jgi:small GTP-binding protein